MPGVAARTRSQVGAARLEPAQLGRIIVARFLELPLRAFERRVHALEQAPDFRALDGILYVGRLTGLAPLRARGTTGNRLLGVIHVDGDKLAFRYASPAFDCVYLFDETAVAERAAKSRTTSSSDATSAAMARAFGIQRVRRTTSGERRNASSSASASGMVTSSAIRSTATTTTIVASVMKREGAGLGGARAIGRKTRH